VSDSGDATEIKLRDLKPSTDYFVKCVVLRTDFYFLIAFLIKYWQKFSFVGVLLFL